MTLHLLKLSVGTEDLVQLARWQARRQRLAGRLFHQTRMMPRRAEELLDGGSIYWVIRGQIRARQRLVGIERQQDQEGRSYTLLLLDPELHRTLAVPHRAFQGWRYLQPEDAPKDLAKSDGLPPDMPAEMAAELQALGLL
ncbi:MAG: DUF1489 domain-containing protein [Pseudomonadota bacterium]